MVDNGAVLSPALDVSTVLIRSLLTEAVAASSHNVAHNLEVLGIKNRSCLTLCKGFLGGRVKEVFDAVCGILDKIVASFTEQGKINKSGRGLI